MIHIELRDNKDGKQDVVDIFLSKDDLSELVLGLSLLADGTRDHLDLFSEDWGGVHLSDKAYIKANSPIRYLKITLADDA